MAWTFRCLNKKCEKIYTADNSEPRCPVCRSKKARWVPRAISIAKVSPGVDGTVRDLAATYEMSDVRSVRAGESAMPRAVDRGNTLHRTFAPGWGIGVNTDAAGSPVATCVPAGVISTIRTEIGKVQPASARISGPRPMIEARHKAQIPRG